MLPDGIEEILPPEAQQVDDLRHQLLALLRRWGYELVIPPMMEFTDSLLVGLGDDVDLLTFKLTDQLSGRSMGVRADMTPQIARIDAHSLKRSGVNRLCYSGHVLHTRMENALSTRSPIQVGLELFGEATLLADIEVTSLLLDVFDHARVEEVCLDLGHVAIYRTLAEAARLNAAQENELFNLLQAKALTDIGAWITENVTDPTAAHWFRELPRLAGSLRVLDVAREVFKGAPDAVFAALDELQQVAETLSNRYGHVRLYFDLSELTGYHYLTGLVFAAFAPGRGTSIARGGRYDKIGEVFGRSRSATGFTLDLVALHRLSALEPPPASGIFAPVSHNPAHWRFVQELRRTGERVVCGSHGQTRPHRYQACDRIVVEEQQTFKVAPIPVRPD